MWWFITGLFIFFLIARKARPAKDQYNLKLSGNQYEVNTSTKKHLIVGTYNVQTGKGIDTNKIIGRRDITKAATVVSGADIVGIQEVYAASWLNRFHLGSCQTSALARRGSFNYLFAATRRRWFREHRGNALLSRIPIKKCEVKMLPDYTNKSYRNMICTEFEFNGTPCHLINTHLHTKNGRQEQLKIVIDEFLKHPNSILLGDFNSTKDEPLLSELLKNPSVVDPIEMLGLDKNSDQRIDWILTRGFAHLEGKIVPKGISDHPYYEVTLELSNE